MLLSVLNKLAGTVKEVKLGTVMAETIIQEGDNQIVSALIKDAADDLALKVGDKVTALAKATSVIVQK